tara:strand:+ start:160 stop:498 length:339 start_codon:yes stop_codon:yes gene_type:complete
MTTTRKINDLITIVNDQQDVEERVYKLAEYIKADYNKYGYKSDYNVTVKKGKKYFKVITENSVHCFVDINNGNVYKPASWNKPAAIVRYNLLDNPQDCYNKCDWSGGYLYIR